MKVNFVPVDANEKQICMSCYSYLLEKFRKVQEYARDSQTDQADTQMLSSNENEK